MQVSVETLNDLERRVTVQVPAERVTQAMQDRLVAMSRRVKVDGFRPGKVPLKIVKRMYGDQVLYETVSELMQNSLHDALVQEKLNPLGSPSIEPKPVEEGQDLEYSATFEVMPEFELSGFESIQVERPVAEVTEQDVDHMIDKLRRQRAIWNAVERPVRDNDRIRFDFEGKIDGQDFAGNKGENTQIVLGEKSLLPDFEARLIGLTAGAEVDFDLTFPEDYQAQEVAGKTAHFQVKLHEIEEAHLPEVDTDAEESSVGETNVNKSSIWHFPHMIVGAIALFFYVGVEVIAGDTIIRYGQSLQIDMSSAKYFTSLTMLGMIIGYICGIIFIPRMLSQVNALRISAVLGIIFTFGAVLSPAGQQITLPFRDLVTFQAVTLTIPVTVLFVALLGLANALIWPSMWPLALNGVGRFTKTASALLVMAVVGGAIIPLIYGKLADIFTTQAAYWVCLPCYLILLYYSLHGYKLKGR